MEAVAENIFGMAGDKQGRSRMKQNGKDIRKLYSSIGILMATGENFPDFAESRVARSVIVEIEKGDYSKEDSNLLAGVITIGLLGGGSYWGYKKYKKS